MRRFLKACVLVGLIAPPRAEAQCGDGSPPPCRASARIDTNAFVVLPFAVSGPPSTQYIGAAMVDLLHMALDGVGRMRIEYAPTTLRRLSDLARPQDAGTASGVALEIGAGRVISGTIVALGSDVRIRAQVYDAVRGRLQYTVEGRATTDNVSTVVDTLASKILARRLVPLADRKRVNLDEYATRSTGALQAYLVARQLARRGERAVAADSLKSALRQDPDFGVAHLLLHRIEGAARGTTGINLDSIFVNAYRRRARFPERVRVMFERGGNRTTRMATEHALATRFPNDPDAAFYLADAYFHAGQNLGEPRERVVAAFERAIALDDHDPELLGHFAVLMAEAGDSTAAFRAEERCHSIAPTVCPNDGMLQVIFRRAALGTMVAGNDTAPLVRTENYLLRMASFDPALGLALTDSLAQLQSPTSRPGARNNAYSVRSLVAMARGQYRKAAEMLDSADALGSQRAGLHLLLDIVSGSHESKASTVRANPGNFVSILIRNWHAAARQSRDSAEKYLRFFDSGPWAGRSKTRAIVTGLRGFVALRAGDTAAALDSLARARHEDTRDPHPLRALYPSASLALLHAQIEAARGNYSRARMLLADVYPINDYVPFIGDAEETRATVALALGDTAAAKVHLRKMIAVWDNADPPLQPRVAAARATLARLEKP
jgi:tetratricopeptide (TPR) repeat protein